MVRPRILAAVAALSFAAATFAALGAAAAAPADTLVSVGSPVTPFSQNKQNEPAVAIDAHAPNVVVAGVQRRDRRGVLCGRRPERPVRSPPGVGVSGVYFSFNGGGSLDAADLHRTERARLPRARPRARRTTGPIGTLPGYYEAGLVSDGDPAVAFGPRRGADGRFSFATARGSTTRTSPRPRWPAGEAPFKGFEAIAVSRTRRRRGRGRGQQLGLDRAGDRLEAVVDHVLRQGADLGRQRVVSSPFFGNVYVCWASFRSNSRGQALPTPLTVARSSDGGDTWTTQPGRSGHGQRQQRPARRLHRADRQHGQRLRVRHRRARRRRTCR